MSLARINGVVAQKSFTYVLFEIMLCGYAGFCLNFYSNYNILAALLRVQNQLILCLNFHLITSFPKKEKACIHTYIRTYIHQTCCNYLAKVIITITITSWK